MEVEGSQKMKRKKISLKWLKMKNKTNKLNKVKTIEFRLTERQNYITSLFFKVIISSLIHRVTCLTYYSQHNLIVKNQNLMIKMITNLNYSRLK